MDAERAYEWSDLLKAFAHPTRLQILGELRKGTRYVTDMEKILPVTQVNISQHLTVLRNAKLVDFAQDGHKAQGNGGGKMKLAMVISQTNPEMVFNAFRLANFSRKEGDEVKVFLLAEGVEMDKIDDPKFEPTGRPKASCRPEDRSWRAERA